MQEGGGTYEVHAGEVDCCCGRGMKALHDGGREPADGLGEVRLARSAGTLSSYGHSVVRCGWYATCNFPWFEAASHGSSVARPTPGPMLRMSLEWRCLDVGKAAATGQCYGHLRGHNPGDALPPAANTGHQRLLLHAAAPMRDRRFACACCWRSR